MSAPAWTPLRHAEADVRLLLEMRAEGRVTTAAVREAVRVLRGQRRRAAEDAQQLGYAIAALRRAVEMGMPCLRLGYDDGRRILDHLNAVQS